ncbi:Endoribonuclease L-PSP [Fibrella aestuarina BUZ 2]|uniref:Endoribonuclease L-PSP n=1 Tax=Fibrella aestuarina BUZ 2 TaxID=1166018 RepID=I0K1X5_9BACT|nr:RidA family protein [Fibrella aestuarina]CCG98128.1 Endoribonuclease L-PSP [Fibrella aestuarina BUZ 2]
MKPQRRSILKRLFASAAGVVGLSAAAKAANVPAAEEAAVQKEVFNVEYQQDVPLFSGSTKLGNLVFVAGKGYHKEGDIKVHTDEVLKELERELIKAGSSMEKVLKVSVFLHDLNDYKAMNEVYKGRFGSKPPVRTTVAVYGGVPGASLVEMDCIAYI